MRSCRNGDGDPLLQTGVEEFAGINLRRVTGQIEDLYPSGLRRRPLLNDPGAMCARVIEADCLVTAFEKGGAMTVTFDSSILGRATLTGSFPGSIFAYFYSVNSACTLFLDSRNGSGFLQPCRMEPQTQAPCCSGAAARDYAAWSSAQRGSLARSMPTRRLPC